MSATLHRTSGRINAFSNTSTSSSVFLARRSIAVVELSPESCVSNHTTRMANICRTLLCIGMTARIVPNLDLLCPRCSGLSQALSSWERFSHLKYSSVKVMATHAHKRTSSILCAAYIPSTDTTTPGFLVFVFSEALTEYQMLTKLSSFQFPHLKRNAHETHQDLRPLSPILCVVEGEKRQKLLVEISRALAVALKKFHAGRVVRRNVSLHSANEPFTSVLRVTFIHQHKRATTAAVAMGSASSALRQRFCVPGNLPIKVWGDILSTEPFSGAAMPIWQPLFAMMIAYSRAFAKITQKRRTKIRVAQYSVRKLLQLPEARFRKAVLESFEQFYGLHALLGHDVPTFATMEGKSDKEILAWMLMRLEYCFLCCYALDTTYQYPIHRALCVLLQKSASREDEVRRRTVHAMPNDLLIVEAPTRTPGTEAPQAAQTPKPPKGKLVRTLMQGVAVGLIATTLSGCGTLTGLDAASSFSCPREDGFSCASMQETFRHVDALPTREPESFAPEKEVTPQANPTETIAVEKTVTEPVASAEGSTNVTTSAKVTQHTAAPSATASADAQRLSADRIERARLPRRVPERFVTIGFAPWSDADGDLHDAHTVIMRLTEAHWSSAAAPAEKKNSAVVHLPFEAYTKNAPRGVAPKAPAKSAPNTPPTPSATRPGVVRGAAQNVSEASAPEPNSETLRQMRTQFAQALAEQEARNTQAAQTPVEGH